MDIRADGTLDYPDEVLSELDVVVAAVHSAMGQDAEKMTGYLEISYTYVKSLKPNPTKKKS